MELNNSGFRNISGGESGQSGFRVFPSEESFSGLESLSDSVSLGGGGGASLYYSAAALNALKLYNMGTDGEVSNAHTREIAEKLLEKRQAGLREEVVVNTDRKMHSIFHGVPDSVKLIDHSDMVFRHYFKDEETRDKVLREQTLVAGPVSYVQSSGGMKKDFVDLKGVFLTLPGVEPGNVGVPGLKDYIDMKLPVDTAVLEIEPGQIYMVPGNPRRADWIVDAYKKYKTGEPIPGYMKATMEKIEAEGGLKEATKVSFFPCEENRR